MVKNIAFLVLGLLLTNAAHASYTPGFQAGDSIGNTGFSVTNTPTVNLGTLNGASTAANQATQITAETAIQSSVANIPAQGNAAAAASTPVTLANAIQVAGATATAVNTDLLSGTVSGWYDAQGWSAGSVNFITTTTITGGVITFEETNDTTNAPAGTVFFLTDTTTATPTFVSTLSLAANTVKSYTFSITHRYIRFRISTAVAGTGTVRATATFRQTPYAPMVQTSTISGTISATVTGTTTTTLAAQTIVTDIASAAKTATATVFVTPTNSASNSFVLAVTAVSGTTPTLDFTMGESYDSGVTCTPLYQFERVTAVLTQPLSSPLIRMGGNRLCYTYTIGGTTPSFTLALTRIPSSLEGSIIRRFFDRTINPNTANSTSIAFFAEDCSQGTTLAVVTNAGTVNPVLTVQASEDGTNWANSSFTMAPTSTGTLITGVTSLLAKYFRLITSTAGVGASFNYVAFRCRGD